MTLGHAVNKGRDRETLERIVADLHREVAEIGREKLRLHEVFAGAFNRAKIAEATVAELLTALKDARLYVAAAAGASHFLEGFGPKKLTVEDVALEDVDAAIAKAERTQAAAKDSAARSVDS